MWLSGGGILLGCYLLYQHYKPAGSSFCNITDYINCDIVNKSTYAEIAGVPVALMGIIAYCLLFAASRKLFYTGSSRNLLLFSTFLAGGSFLFSLYLTVVEFFVLYAICLFCILSQVIILTIFILTLLLWREFSKSSSVSSPSV